MRPASIASLMGRYSVVRYDRVHLMCDRGRGSLSEMLISGRHMGTLRTLTQCRIVLDLEAGARPSIINAVTDRRRSVGIAARVVGVGISVGAIRAHWHVVKAF